MIIYFLQQTGNVKGRARSVPEISHTLAPSHFTAW